MKYYPGSEGHYTVLGRRASGTSDLHARMSSAVLQSKDDIDEHSLNPPTGWIHVNFENLILVFEVSQFFNILGQTTIVSILNRNIVSVNKLFNLKLYIFSAQNFIYFLEINVNNFLLEDLANWPTWKIHVKNIFY